MSEFAQQNLEVLHSFGKALGVDVKKELAERQIERFARFTEYGRLENFLRNRGITDETPRTAIHSFKKDMNGYQLWQLKQPEVIRPGTSFSSLLETTADMAVWADSYPNDFTVGLVIELEDGRQVAVRYKSEECELIESSIRDDELKVAAETETQFDYIQEYEVVLCCDYKQLFWDQDDLVAGRKYDI